LEFKRENSIVFDTKMYQVSMIKYDNKHNRKKFISVTELYHFSQSTTKIPFKAVLCSYKYHNKHFVQGLFSHSVTGGVTQAQWSASVLKHLHRRVVCKKAGPFSQLSNL